MGSKPQRPLMLGRHVIMLAVVLLVLAPVYWMITISLKTQGEFVEYPPTLWPRRITLEWFRALIVSRDYLDYALNSVIVAAIATGVAVGSGSLMAYGLSRFRLPFGLNYYLLFGTLSVRMFPPTVTVVPLFIMFSQTGLLDTYLGLGLVHAMLEVPLVVWLMLGFFREVPVDLEEMALVDGDHRLGAFWKVTLPLVRPGIFATSVLVLIASWNEFLFALILTQLEARTLPIAIQLRGAAPSPIGMAGAILAMLPVMLFVLLVQRHFIRGLMVGGVSGR